jgi:cytochrome P450
LFHATTEDTYVRGYFIPKGTQIMPTIGMVMMNETTFPQPQKIIPERHLNNGKFVPHPQVISFGIGKRRCLGETLARTEIFLFFTGLLQMFSIKATTDPELILIDDSPVYGFTSSPKQFSVTLERR